MKTNQAGLASAIATIQQMFQNAAPQLPPSPKPKIKLPDRPLDKLKPFNDIDNTEAVGMYVTRDVKGLPTSVEVAVEVSSFRHPDPDWEDDNGDVELGNCWRLDSGYQDWLSLEEEQEAIQLFKDRFGR